MFIPSRSCCIKLVNQSIKPSIQMRHQAINNPFSRNRAINNCLISHHQTLKIITECPPIFQTISIIMNARLIRKIINNLKILKPSLKHLNQSNSNTQAIKFIKSKMNKATLFIKTKSILNTTELMNKILVLFDYCYFSSSSILVSQSIINCKYLNDNLLLIHFFKYSISMKLKILYYAPKYV